jgi:hypothetical protein
MQITKGMNGTYTWYQMDESKKSSNKGTMFLCLLILIASSQSEHLALERNLVA